MTRRASSGHGTLAQRVAGGGHSAKLPTHVELEHEGQHHPGILLEWINRAGDWHGRVVWADDDGGVHLQVVDSRSIRRS